MFQSSTGTPFVHWRNWQSAQSSGSSHWKPGRSAMLLAQSWGGSAGFPWRVRVALEKEQALSSLTFHQGIVEHPTRLPGKGNPSMTDLMVIAHLNGLKQNPVTVTLAVEAKVSEDFGPTVAEWIKAAPNSISQSNRNQRLNGLLAPFSLQANQCHKLRYQLIHRAYAAYAYAQSLQAQSTVLLVHSFLSSEHALSHWNDFELFAEVLGVTHIEPNQPVQVTSVTGLSYWLCWVSDMGGLV